MSIIHVCDRCGAATQYKKLQVATKDDPCGQEGMPINKNALCDWCENAATTISKALEEYREQCADAWMRNAPQPDPPKLW